MKWHVSIKCLGRCDFKHEWTGEAKNSNEAKQYFFGSMGNPFKPSGRKGREHTRHIGHKEKKVCEELLP